MSRLRFCVPPTCHRSIRLRSANPVHAYTYTYVERRRPFWICPRLQKALKNKALMLKSGGVEHAAVLPAEMGSMHSAVGDLERLVVLHATGRALTDMLVKCES